jgi:hypothetical protein
MTLNDEIEEIEDLLTSRLIKSNLGIKQVYKGEVSASLQFPSIQLLYKRSSKSDIQTFSGAVVGLVLEFDVNCIFSGIEGEYSVKNAQKFSNNVYDLIQKESLNHYRLDGKCLDLDCESVEHGVLNFNDVFVYGGKITLEIEILHTIGE